ncbi:hypothetical protein SAMN03159339_2876 [Variovorax sp. 770b2]|nr:hypothetical protein SAMN03159339_2876 [Variovorax sp. 770b2]
MCSRKNDLGLSQSPQAAVRCIPLRWSVLAAWLAAHPQPHARQEKPCSSKETKRSRRSLEACWRMRRLSGSIATSSGCLLSRIGDVFCGPKFDIRCASTDVRFTAEAGRRSAMRDPKLKAMTSSVFSATRSVFLSNQRFAALLDFAVTVGNSKAANAEESEFVARLVSSTSDMYLGFDLSIEDYFPAATQQDFWRRVFLEVAAQIRNGSIGNTDPPTEWRSKAADDAEAIAGILTTRPLSA